MTKQNNNAWESSFEYEFLKGHIAATIALMSGLIAQNAVDSDALSDYFRAYTENLPKTRETLPMRLLIDQWRRCLDDGEAIQAADISALSGGGMN